MLKVFKQLVGLSLVLGMTACSIPALEHGAGTPGSDVEVIAHGVGDEDNIEAHHFTEAELLAHKVIYFGFDSNEIAPAAAKPLVRYEKATVHPAMRADSILNAYADVLKASPKAHIRLMGHTDSRGTSEYNIALGERRANAVAHYLELKGGVSPQQVTVVSYGEEKPVALGHTESVFSLNRRVEIALEGS